MMDNKQKPDGKHRPIVSTLGFILSADSGSVLMLHGTYWEDDENIGMYNGIGGKAMRSLYRSRSTSIRVRFTDTCATMGRSRSNGDTEGFNKNTARQKTERRRYAGFQLL